MSDDHRDDQLNALLRRLQGLEAYASQLRDVLKEQARLCLELAKGRPELPAEVGDALVKMAWKGENAAALTPEILEAARGQHNEEEIAAGLREIQATGGLQLGDFLHELEQAAGPHE